VLPECHKYKPKKISARSARTILLYPTLKTVTVSWVWLWVTIATKILAAPNQRSLAICLVGSQQTYFQLRAAFFSLAPSSAKGYYATANVQIRVPLIWALNERVTQPYSTRPTGWLHYMTREQASHSDSAQVYFRVHECTQRQLSCLFFAISRYVCALQRYIKCRDVPDNNF